MSKGNKVVVVREHVVRKVAGVGLGSLLAVLCSWTVNKSVVWACVHFIFGWLYVFYACCAHTDRLDVAAHEVLDRGAP